MTARIYTIVNQKGGVGKTTTAINLGAFLAKLGRKVLIVDLDPQANATSSLGVNKQTVKNGIYEVLMSLASVSSSLLSNPKVGLTLLPSSPALAGAEVELVGHDKRDSFLKNVLASVVDHFDYILIDCPPSLGLLTVNGLMAARDGVIIPVQCEYLALEGISQLSQTLQRVRQSMFPGLKIRGVLMTMYDSRVHLSTDVVEEIRKHFPDKVFKAIVPRSIRLAEAPSYGLPISVYAPASAGAQAYMSLAKELLEEDDTFAKAHTSMK